MELSKRMQAIADMITPGRRVCDVGCDHAYIPIYLLEEKIALSALACDVKQGPLQIAQANIKEHGLEQHIHTRLSNGLDQVEKGEADAVVIAGMGGKLIMQILEASMDKVVALKELILQPQSELEFVRAFLREKNLHILQENMVEEDGKYYQILKVSPLTAVHNQTLPLSRETQDLFGPCLLLDKNPVLVRFLRHREQITLKILSQMQAEGAGEKDRDRMQQLLSCIREALEYVEA